jgi:TusE/DsrC/DsvC family sulfur relay protein
MATVLDTIEFNEEGFMTDSNAWTKEIGELIAKGEDIENLNENHWIIIDFCRKTGEETGKSPTLRQITTGTGISTKELFALYPKGPAKKVAKISGLGKPEGCV